MTSKSLTYLKSRRTILRKQIAKNLELLDSLLQSDVTAESLSLFQRKCQALTGELQEARDKLESFTDSIIEQMPEPTDEAIEEEEASKLEYDLGSIRTAMHEAAATQRKFQKDLTPPTLPKDLDLEAENARLQAELEQLRQGSPPFSPTGNNPRGATVRLPKLEVEKFDGNILKYKEFRDYFEVAVGANQFLKPVEKLNYLRAYLTGDAKRVIAGLTAADENYGVAVALLNERYGDTQTSIDAHYSKLMELQAVPNETSRIRALLDQVESHLRCLEALDEDTEHRHFISLLMSKLPPDMITHLEEMKGAKTAWTVQLLRTNIHNILNAREIAERQVTASKHQTNAGPNPTKFSRDNRQGFRSTTDALIRRQQSDEESQTTLAANQTVLLQTAYTSARNPESTNRTLVRALLDSGSNRTYITSNLANRLNLKLRDKETFSVGTFGSQKRLAVRTSIAELEIQLKDGTFKRLDVNVVDRITSPVSRIPIHVDLSKFIDKFQELPLADSLPGHVEKYHIDLLIGSDYYLDFVTGKRFEIQTGLYLLASKLGWLITGRIDSNYDVSNETAMIVDTRINTTSDHLKPLTLTHQMDNDFPIKPNMQDLWNLESIGIQDKPDIVDDDKAIESFNQTVTRSQDGRYLVTWPWKESKTDLPTNYQLSRGRFKSLAKKFQSNAELFQKYKTIIKEQEELKIIEKTSDIGQTNPPVWPRHYIPHHPVVTPTKATTKVRIVYDASAKASKAAPSLNDCLYRGPIILEDLCGLLLRFRLHRIAIVADIEKAFLQVGLQEPDRDVTRFFWFQDYTDPKVDNNVQVYRFCRVPFGVISSPFLLGATLKHHLATEGERTSPETANKILSGLYVDNVVTGADSTDKATEFYCQAKTIFQQASMNLREWNSNDQAFLQHIADVDRAETKKQKVLGLAWDIQQDLLSITGIVTEDSAQATTKRQVLKRTASIYEPLGLFAPITLKAKLLLRNVCDQGLDWDAPLEADDLATWSKICEDPDRIPTCQIPRVVGNLSDNPNQAQQNQLVCFCDASTLAYAATVYLRIETATSVQINLVFTKTRLSPPNRMTIPRLELMAALIAVRCLSFVESQMKLPFTAKYVWTDSMCVLSWLTSNKQKSVFVENRLKEIRKVSKTSFRYIKGTENPADMATRGESYITDLKASNWFHGPSWLEDNEARWPTWEREPIASDVDLEERASSKPQRIFECGASKQTFEGMALPSTNTSNQSDQISPFGINCHDYSSLTKLHRVTAFANRFIARLKKVNPVDSYLT